MKRLSIRMKLSNTIIFFDTSVHDITKKNQKLLTENRHDIDKIILMPRRPELGKSRSYLVEVLISYALQSDTVTNKKILHCAWEIRKNAL